jgi:general secretion pathway protein J
MCFDTNRGYRSRTFYSDGYTLIEVLVAMAIFTSMLVLAGTALNQGLRQYQGLVEQGIGFWDYAKTLWIDKSFNSASDYYVYTRSDGWFPYFRGKQDSVSYVSLSPFAGEFPAAVWLKNEAQEDGKRTLRYYELPIYTKTFEDLDRDEVFGDYKKGKTFDLLKDVEGITFSFYGCDAITRQCRWSTEFEGSKMKGLPSAVKIEYRHDGEKGALVFDIHVNSGMKKAYNEMYQKQ